MKTQKIAFILAIFMAFSLSTSAQTRQQKKALERVTTEKATLERELVDLETSIATYVAVDTMPTFSRKKEIDIVLTSGEMSLTQQAAYKSQSQKLGQKLASMRQQLLVANAGIKTDKARSDEIKQRLQKLNESQTKLVDSQIDEAINQKIPQEMTRNEAKRRHFSNGVEFEDIKVDLQHQYAEKRISLSNPDKLGYFGKVYNQSKYTNYTFRIFEKESGIECKTFVLYPGQVVGWYFLPGQYVYEIYAYDPNVPVDRSTFSVPKPSNVFGEELNWAVGMPIDTPRPIIRPVYK